jgi:hypothetical protein
MPIITQDRAIHTTVLAVNILSWASHHVKIGNVKYDIPNPKNLGPHSPSMATKPYFVPCQKNNDAGIPKSMAAIRGLSDHQCHTTCELEANHTQVWPPNIHKQAMII